MDVSKSEAYKGNPQPQKVQSTIYRDARGLTHQILVSLPPRRCGLTVRVPGCLLLTSSSLWDTRRYEAPSVFVLSVRLGWMRAGQFRAETISRTQEFLRGISNLRGQFLCGFGRSKRGATEAACLEVMRTTFGRGAV